MFIPFTCLRVQAVLTRLHESEEMVIGSLVMSILLAQDVTHQGRPHENLPDWQWTFKLVFLLTIASGQSFHDIFFVFRHSSKIATGELLLRLVRSERLQNLAPDEAKNELNPVGRFDKPLVEVANYFSFARFSLVAHVAKSLVSL